MEPKVKLSDETLRELMSLARRTAEVADSVEMDDVRALLESDEFLHFISVMSPELVMFMVEEILEHRAEKVQKWAVV